MEGLRNEVVALRNEIDRLRSEQVRTPAAAPAPAPVGGSEDDLRSSLMREIGSMMDAKLAGLQDRLLPEKRLRPPLKADLSVSQAGSNGANKKGPAKTAAAKPTPSAPSAGKTPSQEPQRLMETWTEVVRGRRRKAKTASVPAAGPAVLSQGEPPARHVATTRPLGKVKPKRTKAPTDRLRPPRSAAVVLTLTPEALEQGLSYEKVLVHAKESINLAQLEISGLKFRRARTGARVLELPGKETGPKADCLAEKLREVLPEVVRVTRPIKCADLRISGLDDSVSAADIKAAVARTASCPPEQVKVGPLRTGLFGASSALVQCPVLAAKSLVDSGRLLVGWSAARVQALEPKPLKCFRCFEIGHTAVQCSSKEDRSKSCFCCGELGHWAVACTSEPSCPICKSAGRPANHASGGRRCKRLKTGKGASVRTPVAPSQNSGQPPKEAMETGH